MTDEAGGNAETLREASAGWRDMARQLEEIINSLDQSTGSAFATYWKGPAAEAFGENWSRLRKSVDEALPAFASAATDLDSAAEHMERPRGAAAGRPVEGSSGAASNNRLGGEGWEEGQLQAGRDPESTSTTVHSSDTASTPHGGPEQGEVSTPPAFQAAYAMTALTQIGAALSSFQRGGSGAGKGGRSSLARAGAHGESEAPRTADPFGPPETNDQRKQRLSGGLGIARGRRTGGTGSPAPVLPRLDGSAEPDACPAGQAAAPARSEDRPAATTATTVAATGGAGAGAPPGESVGGTRAGGAARSPEPDAEGADGNAPADPRRPGADGGRPSRPGEQAGASGNDRTSRTGENSGADQPPGTGGTGRSGQEPRPRKGARLDKTAVDPRSRGTFG
ncbi:WXG100 family type VII secretion target [Streptomyces sp. NPDC048639]|uniref:WXG100 family type VII secretion target n=1 Tax=Streptomyces sp. NPDC048639 TaxID=3365581 RepID=UPI0037221838